MKSIEIPPPRPKRKPVHPYPRKLVSPVKTGIIVPEKTDRCTGKENQSPTSVLSALGSDQSVGAESFMPNDSPSPVSSAYADNTGNVLGFAAPKFLSEDENSSIDEEIPMVLFVSLYYQFASAFDTRANSCLAESAYIYIIGIRSFTKKNCCY